MRRRPKFKNQKLRDDFSTQRANADIRCIPFLLTFSQWLKIWKDSGHLYERGRGKGKYCMARFGDIGPYAVSNVKIILFSENASEKILSNAAKEKIRQANLGKKYSDETRRKQSIAGMGNKRALGHSHPCSEENKKMLSGIKKGVPRPLWVIEKIKATKLAKKNMQV